MADLEACGGDVEDCAGVVGRHGHARHALNRVLCQPFAQEAKDVAGAVKGRRRCELHRREVLMRC